MEFEDNKPIIKKAKTRRGKKILQALEPKLVEGEKRTVFLKATKTSELITALLKDLYTLKKENSVILGKKLDTHPFEGTSFIEHFSNKNDSALFAFGSNSKKRPDNLVIGRVYNKVVLDMVEFGVQDYKSTKFFSDISIPLHSRPCVFFQGDLFEYDSVYMKLKNVLLDFFVENISLENLDLLKGFSHLVVVSAHEKSIYVRTYAIQINEQLVKSQQLSKDDFFTLKEIGPSFNLAVRRTQFSNTDQFKAACKQPKIKKKKQDKNVKSNALGEKKGRLYVDNEDIKNLGLKKRKKLKENGNLKRKNKNNEVEDENGQKIEKINKRSKKIVSEEDMTQENNE